jgi:4-diphosphocytidyl-2-C-methyl-D-erythritol kinase
MSALLLEAPAKVNLELGVIGRRDDGMHLLDGRFVLLELADRLLLMPGCSGLRVDGARDPSMPVDGENLAWRGLVAGMGGEPELACLTLEKRIPSRAGLGGGSSDAAAAWRLGRAWRGASSAATPPDLAELSRIGADVPFFAAQVAAAHVGGIGERVEPMTPLDAHVVLAHDSEGLSTAAVFAELRPDEWGTAENDLLAPALRLRPRLAEVMALVAAAGGEPRLTGSGPTIFTMTDDAERAAHIAARLAEAGVDVTITRTRTSAATIEPLDDDQQEESS